MDFFEKKKIFVQKITPWQPNRQQAKNYPGTNFGKLSLIIATLVIEPQYKQYKPKFKSVRTNFGNITMSIFICSRRIL